MTLYRVTYSHEGGTSTGYEWFSSKRDAQRAAAGFCRRTDMEDGDATVNAFTVQPTKAGILDALNKWATYPDNG